MIPPGLSALEFRARLEQTRIDYILATQEMIRRRQHSVGPYLAYSPGEGVQILRLEPEWEVIYRGPPPSRFILIRVR
jgi:hypothetical protein